MMSTPEDRASTWVTTHATSPANRERSSRSKFSPEEDEQLRTLVAMFGEENWHAVAARMPNRNARQCRERWGNYLLPTLNTADWTSEEDRLLVEKCAEFGTKWVRIAAFFPNRTDVMIKNRFHVLQRRETRDEELQRDCDPVLMMMILGACQLNPRQTKREIVTSPSISPEGLQSISTIEADFESWTEPVDYDYFDF
jgi:hypothetical protein